MQDRASATDQALVEAHAKLRQDDSFQFDRVGYAPPSAEWLEWIADLLRAAGPILRWVFWAGVAVLAGLLLWAIAREILRLRRAPPGPEKPTAADAPEWRPQEDAARDLLAEADRLAAQGQYAEAAHILLLRTVADVERQQPNVLRVSLTTREISALGSLPETGRAAFAYIGRIVERSLFGGAPVSADEFADCRRAYEAFALPASELS